MHLMLNAFNVSMQVVCVRTGSTSIDAVYIFICVACVFAKSTLRACAIQGGEDP